MCRGSCKHSPPGSPAGSCCRSPEASSLEAGNHPAPGGKGDSGWWKAWAELHPLHVAKSGTYGTPDEPLANYVNTSRQLGQPDEYTPMVRIIEKLERAKALILAGRADEVKDWPDIAACAIGAEALRRRRI